ncbi:MAG: hypothetical protein UT63_C0025G0006 [Candidatus Gottesmanbacteria bacterium GW2011_GWC2_39_8]|uniref:SpoVT-AbrB domain-containing protein n=1 Tax=Candidatus Gottesmanbacteria bacterium GW2011_GWC2_39_8 TaxID=1618450 RepID=A0A0G0PY17_9BACT|nr:MAG: hypothetical protein UT63_C0025G0006 [Candidatus Gottesmanbacteria bacterium GW2011_GWC2_39_8]
MQILTVSSKRQITLPKDFLDDFGIKPGGKIYIEESGNSICIKSAKSVVEESAGSLNKYVDKSRYGVTFEKIMEETRRKTAKKLISIQK